MTESLLFPSRTYIGSGQLFEIPVLTKMLGAGIIVHGQSFWKKKEYKLLQGKLAVKKSFYQYKGGEPGLADVRELIAYCRTKKAAWIAGIGGGSVLDLAKIAAGLYYAGEDPEFYFQGGIIGSRGIPFIAIPTTTGSGSEATNVAVIINEKNKEKSAIRENSLLAHSVILDPNLLIGLDHQVAANSAFDAITHVVEGFFSRRATWFTETLALKAFELLTKNTERFYELLKAKSNEISQEYVDMQLGSYYAGLAFGNSGLGIVHGMSYSLAAIFGAPHGQVCANLLVPSLQLNKDFVNDKYSILSKLVGRDLSEFLTDLKGTLKIENPFKAIEIETKPVIASTLGSPSTKANPKEVKDQDVLWMLAQLTSK